MKIGLIGYKGSGKSTLFEWLAGVPADPSKSHTTQSAMAEIPEPRMADLCKIYKPKKVVHANMEILDTPGLSRDQEGNASVMGYLREADYLVCIVPVFDGSDPQKEIDAFQEELIFADLEIVLNRIDRIHEQKKRPLGKEIQEKLAFELETLEVLKKALEAGHPVRAGEMTNEQYKATRSFQFLTEKNRMIFINTGDEEQDHAKYQKYATPELPVAAVSLSLEVDLQKMDSAERASFLAEMDLKSTDRNTIVRMLMDNSGQMVFLTAGEKEVRSWLMSKNGTAIEAAGCIHTDFIKKFIRAEVTPCDDLVRTYNELCAKGHGEVTWQEVEREIKAANLNRRETKDYIILEGDVLLFHIAP